MTKSSIWDKFLLLLWKNWLIQFRHPIQTAFEILIPICVCSFLLLIRGLVNVTEESEPLKWNPIEMRNNFIFRDIFLTSVNTRIAYSPKSPVLEEIMSNVVEKLNYDPNSTWTAESFADPIALEGNALSTTPFLSVQFDQELAGLTVLPDNINYAIRFPGELRTSNELLERMGGFTNNWATNIRFGLDFLPGPRNPASADGGEPPGYLRVS